MCIRDRRHILRTLLPYFLEPGESRVVNTAAYRLTERDPLESRDGFLADRALYPRSARHWELDARQAIDRFSRAFEPHWQPPRGAFSDWHFTVVSASPGSRPRYRKPVVILQDVNSFSATDVFLGAFKGLENVTLMGTASGGGSGRARGLELAHSRIGIRLSTMASFQPDGRLYDGQGVTPDAVVLPGPEYFIGEGDRQLEAALNSMREE